MASTRRLAAILAADIVGYSRLMGLDEAGTAQALREHRAAAEPLITGHGGRIVKTTGDGVLIEFGSVVGAVECALVLQHLAAEPNAAVAGDRRMEWRLGVHLGDVLIEGDDILGDGVNIAARLEGIAEPGGICISEDAFRQVRGKVEVEFADLGEQSLKNIARPLRVYRVETAARTKQTATPAPALPLPDKPSIAVLPFANISGDPEQEYFADGMVEEIITALSRIRWLFVIARNSSFTYKGQSVDVKRVGGELGVRYVLEGSVRRGGNRVRITGELIDATDGAHLWADHFDGSLENVFDLQDNVALSVAGVIAPTLQEAEMRRSSDRPTNDITAYDLYLRAIEPIHSGEREKKVYVQALDLFGLAIDRDPGFGPALAAAAFCHHVLHVTGWTDDAGKARREAIELAGHALRVAGKDAEVLGQVARVLGYFGEDLAGAIALIDRALELNPSLALGWQWNGWLRLWAGQPDVAIGHFEASVRLNPLQGRMDYYLGLGMGHFFTRRFEDAAASLRLSLQKAPGWPPTYRFLAACYAHLGKLAEAREAVRRLRAITPLIVPEALQWRNPEHRELYLSGLRSAAGEAK